jgi:hypothetical protein
MKNVEIVTKEKIIITFFFEELKCYHCTTIKVVQQHSQPFRAKAKKNYSSTNHIVFDTQQTYVHVYRIILLIYTNEKPLFYSTLK